jgi:hypothetical protein
MHASDERLAEHRQPVPHEVPVIAEAVCTWSVLLARESSRKVHGVDERCGLEAYARLGVLYTHLIGGSA